MGAPFELVLAVNPLMVTSFLPLMSYLMVGHRFDSYNLLILVRLIVASYTSHWENVFTILGIGDLCIFNVHPCKMLL